MITEFRILLITLTIINTGSMIFLGHLITFHIYLNSKKLTTFEYIQLKKDRPKKSKIIKEIDKSEEKPLKDSENEKSNPDKDKDDIESLRDEDKSQPVDNSLLIKYKIEPK